MTRRERGQLVLLAAAVLAVALVPVVLTYLQLGYHEDVAASGDYDAPGEDAARFLDRTVHDAATTVGTDDWGNRRAVVTAVHGELDPRLERLAVSRVESGVAYSVAYNRSAARAWRREHCPSGPNRQFGGCVADRGVVVQRRAGNAHTLAVALDVTVTTERGRSELTFVVETVGGA